MVKDEAEIRKIVEELPVFSEINLDAVEKNVRSLKAHIGKETKLMAVVKDDAYGHGALEVSRSALSGGADYLGVVSVKEGLELREGGVSAPTLVLGRTWKWEIEDAIRENLEISVFEEETAFLIDDYAKSSDKTVGIFIKVDTGMGRLGILPDDLTEVIKKISSLKNIRLKGLFSHFPIADEDEEFTGEQYDKFFNLIENLNEDGFELPLNHIANSVATISYPEYHLGMVRVGLSLYGYYPENIEKVKDLDLNIVMSLRARIAQVREMEKGVSISYKREYFTDKKTRIAVIPVGYADGYMRSMSNRAYGIYRGKRIPQVGIICMDMSMFELGIDSEAKAGDIVTLLGYDREEMIGADELARCAGTIPYEILTYINGRVVRIYIKGGKVVNIEYPGIT